MKYYLVIRNSQNRIDVEQHSSKSKVEKRMSHIVNNGKKGEIIWLIRGDLIPVRFQYNAIAGKKRANPYKHRGSRVKKLSVEKAREIKNLKGKIPARELAEKFNVTPWMIYGIWNGKYWGDA